MNLIYCEIHLKIVNGRAEQDNLKIFTVNKNMLKRFISGGESWVYGYESEKHKTTTFTMEPSIRITSEKAPQNQSNVKSLLIVFSDYEGVLHHEYSRRGQAVNKEYYVEILKILRDTTRR